MSIYGNFCDLLRFIRNSRNILGVVPLPSAYPKCSLTEMIFDQVGVLLGRTDSETKIDSYFKFSSHVCNKFIKLFATFLPFRHQTFKIAVSASRVESSSQNRRGPGRDHQETSTTGKTVGSTEKSGREQAPKSPGQEDHQGVGETGRSWFVN